MHFVDGVRLRAHDGDRGVVGEWHARRWELSEDDLALFGESRRVGIEGGEESGSPGSKLSPSISSAVEGLRVALSPVDTVADPHDVRQALEAYQRGCVERGETPRVRLEWHEGWLPGGLHSDEAAQRRIIRDVLTRPWEAHGEGGQREA